MHGIELNLFIPNNCFALRHGPMDAWAIKTIEAYAEAFPTDKPLVENISAVRNPPTRGEWGPSVGARSADIRASEGRAACEADQASSRIPTLD